MSSLHAPKGRPPIGYVWDASAGAFLSVKTGEPFCATRRREQFLQKRRSYENARYWNSRTGVRVRRLQRSAKSRGGAVKLIQSKLSDFA